MAMPDINYEFLSKAGRILSLGQSRSIMLTGNVPDLFYIPGDKGGRYVPLIEWMTERWNLPGENIIIVYELNSPIMFAREADREKNMQEMRRGVSSIIQSAKEGRDM